MSLQSSEYDHSFPVISTSHSGSSNPRQDEHSETSNRRTFASLLSGHAPQNDGSDTRGGTKMNISKSLLICEERRLKGVPKRKHEVLVENIRRERGVSIEIHETNSHDLNVVVSGGPEAVDGALDAVLVQLTTAEKVPVPDYIPPGLLRRYSETFRELENTTDCRISIPGQGKFVNIYSTNNNSITAAVGSVNIFFKKLRDVTIETLKIPCVYHAWIRGPFDCTVIDIRRETETEITIPPIGSNRTEITVSGAKENVTRAVAAIHLAYKDQVASLEHMTIDLPRGLHKVFTDQNYHNVHKILERTNVSLELPSSSMSTSISLRGSSNQALGEALSMIHKVANTAMEETIAIPTILVNTIRAKMTNVRKHLEKVSVELTKSNNLLIKGTSQNVARARSNFKEILDMMMASVKEERIEIERQYVSAAFGRGRQRMTHFLSEYNVHVRPQSGGTRFILEGTEDCIEVVKKEIMQSVERARNESVIVLPIKQEFHGKIIGARGSKIQQIKKMFNVNIAIPVAEENKDEVRIRGTAEEVERCAMYINSFVSDMKSSDYSEEVSIPKSIHKLVIGRGGSTVNEIRRATNASVDIPPPNDPSENITLRGAVEDVKSAKKMIMEIAESRSEQAFKIPSRVIGNLTRSNQIMGYIKQSCPDTQILPASHDEPGKFIIRGSRDAVKKAMDFIQNEITKALEENHCADVPMSEMQMVYVENNCLNVIFNIREQHGVGIQSLPADAEMFGFRILGKEENVHQAKLDFEKEIRQIGEIVENNVVVPAKYHGRFLSRDGAMMRDLRETFSVYLIVPSHRSSSEEVIVRGNQENVAAAIKRIQELLDDWENETAVTVECDFAEYLHNNSVALIRPLENKFNVHVEFPAETERVETGTNQEHLNGVPSSSVIIKGREENCFACKEEILELAPQEDHVAVPRNMHARIVGKKGTEIARIKRESGVSEILVPRKDEWLDQSAVNGATGDVDCEDRLDDGARTPPITLRGSASAVEKAKNMITRIVSAGGSSRFFNDGRSSPGYSTTIDVPKHLHPRLIGKFGKTINSLRRDFHVTVEVPPIGSGPDETVITLFGQPDDCEAAKTAIVNLTSTENEGTREGSPQRSSRFAEVARGSTGGSRNYQGMSRYPVMKTTIVDPSSIPRLIGTRGRSINKFREQYQVEVKFSNNNENPDVVTVSGQTDDIVDEAIEALMRMSMDSVNDSMDHRREETSYRGRGSDYQESYGRSRDRPDAARPATGGNRPPPPDTSDLTEFPSF